jgi:hypothetical protein
MFHLQDGRILDQLGLHLHSASRQDNSAHAWGGNCQVSRCTSPLPQEPADGWYTGVTRRQDIAHAVKEDSKVRMECSHPGISLFPLRSPSTSGVSMDHIRLGIHGPRGDTTLAFDGRRADSPRGKHVGKPNPGKVRLALLLWLVALRTPHLTRRNNLGRRPPNNASRAANNSWYKYGNCRCYPCTNPNMLE